MRFRLALATLLLVLLSSCASSAPDRRERIIDFHSDITLEPDGTFLVRETITVNAAGSRIRHGIFRDFPTRYQDRFGNKYVVGFTLLSAEYDGYAEKTRVQEQLQGKRIYLGDQKLVIPPGQHTYVISYSSNRQLGFFPDHDEMYWNVTGNGWLFSIDHASATVTVPPNISNDDVRLDGFTGRLHSFDRNLTHRRQPDGTYFFETTLPLGEFEGLSIVLSWPKGLIAPPTKEQQLSYFFSDNRTALLSLVGLLILILYYVLVWYAVGRDPDRGVIMPRYEPPADLSPAGARFLVRMGFDNKTLAAAILDMAVRGFLTIKEQAGSYTLYRTPADLRVLTPDERQLAGVLFDGHDQLWLDKENHTRIQSGLTTLKSWLKLTEEKVYFFTNRRYLIPGVVFSVVMILGVAALGSPLSFFGTAFLTFWLSIWSLACAGLAVACGTAWRAAFAARSSKSLLAGKATVLTLFSLPFFGGEAMGIFFLIKLSSIFIAGFLFFSAALHIVFHYLLKAPTVAGRRLLDQVDGFKLFLGAVDGDRLNRTMPQDKTPETFEKFLPYALALDLEQAWSQRFAAELGAAGQTPTNGSGYTPSFYSGTNWGGFTAASFSSGFASSFTDAVSSSSSPPGSTSGGGSDGGSGGGGGGGGGGGW